jgi:hypothetical protein
VAILDSDELRMLVDIGFIALSRGADRHAEAIFAGVQAVRPGEEAGHLGAALVHLYRGEVDPAVAILRKLPPSDAAQTFLGLALSRRGEGDEASRVLNGVVATAPDTAFASLARDLLNGKAALP